MAMRLSGGANFFHSHQVALEAARKYRIMQLEHGGTTMTTTTTTTTMMMMMKWGSAADKAHKAQYISVQVHGFRE